jgi:hypothetical protein
VNNGQRKTRYQRDLAMLPFNVTSGKIQRHPGKRSSHFETPETLGRGGCLANPEDAAAHAATSPLRMDKESSYLRRIVRRVEKSILAAGVVVTAKKSLALAPASAARFHTVAINPGFGYKIGSIVNQLGIYTENVLEGQLQLFGGVVGRLQSQNGRADEFLERGDIGGNGLPDGEEHGTF